MSSIQLRGECGNWIVSRERCVRSLFKKRKIKSVRKKVGIKKQKRDRQKWTERKKKKERERREGEGERKQWREAFRELLELLIIRVGWRGGDIYAHKRPRYISSTWLEDIPPSTTRERRGLSSSGWIYLRISSLSRNETRPSDDPWPWIHPRRSNVSAT